MANPSKSPNLTIPAPPNTDKINKFNESSHIHARVEQPAVVKISEIVEDELSNYLFSSIDANDSKSLIDKVNNSHLSPYFKSDNVHIIRRSNTNNRPKLITVAQKKATFISPDENSAPNANREEFSRNIRKTPYIYGNDNTIELKDDEIYAADTIITLPLKKESNISSDVLLNFNNNIYYNEQASFIHEQSDTLNISRSLNFDDVDHYICDPQSKIQAEEILKKSPLFSDLFGDAPTRKGLFDGNKNRRVCMNKKNEAIKIEMLRGDHSISQQILNSEINLIDNPNSYKLVEEDVKQMYSSNISESLFMERLYASPGKIDSMSRKSNKCNQRLIETPIGNYKGNNKNYQLENNKNEKNFDKIQNKSSEVNLFGYVKANTNVILIIMKYI